MSANINVFSLLPVYRDGCSASILLDTTRKQQKSWVRPNAVVPLRGTEKLSRRGRPLWDSPPASLRSRSFLPRIEMTSAEKGDEARKVPNDRISF